MKSRTLFLLLPVFLTACGGTKLHYSQEGVAPNPEPKVNSERFLTTLYDHRLGGSFDAQTGILRPAPTADAVIVAGPDGKVSAIDATSGNEQWEIDLDLPLSAGVGIGDGLAVVANRSGQVIALRLDDGSETWRGMVNGEVLAPPAISPGVVIVRAGDSKIVGLDSATGSPLWTLQKNIEGLSVRGVSAPLINGRGAVVGLADGRILALDVDSGRGLWETPIGTQRGDNEVRRLADIDADPVLFGTILYVASYQSRVVAMALGTPRVIWSADISTLKTPGVDSDRLYISTETGTIVALNRFTGEKIWEQSELIGRGLTSPVRLGERLLVGDFKGVIYSLDPETGEIVASESIGGGALVGTPVKVGDTVLFTSESGRIHALALR
ncbi:MAG: outer membrane protein assembly factor BamB [marine bacterium B5-7]|nr:MAG: outer membrane protein assembly factor BamB [marine bacterium B5-7]